MSLGFLTESALMPSKAKKIEVDSKSMIGLKALVYESEQKSKLNAAGRTQGHRKLRNKEPRAKPSAEKRNKNVEERIRKDEEDLTEVDKTKHYQSALRAKAAIYDKIKRGEIEHGAESAFLVDFQRKREQDDYVPEPASDDEEDSLPTNDPGSEESDIEDEFGRIKTVKRRSIEYREYHANKRQRQQEAAVRPESFSNVEPEQAPDAASIYAWSTGAGREDVGEWMSADQRKAAEEVQQAVEREIRMSKSARVRTQWETTLDSSARDFIHQVHKEAEVERAQAAESQLSARDKRRELLRQKKAAREQRQS